MHREGRALDVAHLVEGSVRKAGDHVCIAAQLVNAKTGFRVWGEMYEREVTAAERALTLDPDEGAAHYALGTIALLHDRDFEAAAEHIGRWSVFRAWVA